VADGAPEGMNAATPVAIDTSDAEAQIAALQEQVNTLRASMEGLPTIQAAASSPLSRVGARASVPMPGGSQRGLFQPPSRIAGVQGLSSLNGGSSPFRFMRTLTPPPAAEWAANAATPSAASGYVQSARTLKLTQAAQSPGVFAQIGGIGKTAKSYGIRFGGRGLVSINSAQLLTRLGPVAGFAAAAYAAIKVGENRRQASQKILQDQLRDPTTLDFSVGGDSDLGKRLTQWAQDEGRTNLSLLYAPIKSIGGGVLSIGAVGITAGLATLGFKESAQDFARFAADANKGLDVVSELITGNERKEWEKAVSQAKERAKEASKILAQQMLGYGFPGTRREIESAIEQVAREEFTPEKSETLVGTDYLARWLFGATE